MLLGGQLSGGHYIRLWSGHSYILNKATAIESHKLSGCTIRTPSHVQTPVSDEQRVVRLDPVEYIFFSRARQPPSRPGPPSSLSILHDHTQFDTLHSVGILWTSDQPDIQTFT